jgi:predicted RNase H-like nuclease (RuvC/YqgF family)
LEEEIARSRRQQDEHAAVVETNRNLEQQMVHSNRQLEEKQRIIADLEGQLRSDRQKIEELVTKLRNNGQLLMKIYQELDKSIHFNDIPKEP